MCQAPEEAEAEGVLQRWEGIVHTAMTADPQAIVKQAHLKARAILREDCHIWLLRHMGCSLRQVTTTMLHTLRACTRCEHIRHATCQYVIAFKKQVRIILW